MRLKEICPFVRKALDNSLSASVRKDVFVRLRSRDYRLFLCHEGAGNIVIEGEKYELSPQCLIFLPSGTEYVWQPEESIRILTVNFDFTENHSYIKQSFHPQRSVEFSGALERVEIEDAACFSGPIVLYHAGNLENRLRELIFTYCTQSTYREESLSAMMKTILISIADTIYTEGGSSVKNRLVYDVIRYVYDNYREGIDSRTLSERFHFSMTYINRVFKEKTGDSVHRFLIKYRIKIAAELLSSGMYTVAEVAEAVGFNDVYHFSKTFKTITSRTPGSYSREGG